MFYSCYLLTVLNKALCLCFQGFQGKTGPPGPGGVVGPQVTKYKSKHLFLKGGNDWVIWVIAHIVILDILLLFIKFFICDADPVRFYSLLLCCWAANTDLNVW